MTLRNEILEGIAAYKALNDPKETYYWALAKEARRKNRQNDEMERNRERDIAEAQARRATGSPAPMVPQTASTAAPGVPIQTGSNPQLAVSTGAPPMLSGIGGLYRDGGMVKRYERGGPATREPPSLPAFQSPGSEFSLYTPPVQSEEERNEADRILQEMLRQRISQTVGPPDEPPPVVPEQAFKPDIERVRKALNPPLPAAPAAPKFDPALALPEYQQNRFDAEGNRIPPYQGAAAEAPALERTGNRPHPPATMVDPTTGVMVNVEQMPDRPELRTAADMEGPDYTPSELAPTSSKLGRAYRSIVPEAVDEVDRQIAELNKRKYQTTVGPDGKERWPLEVSATHQETDLERKTRETELAKVNQRLDELQAIRDWHLGLRGSPFLRQQGAVTTGAPPTPAPTPAPTPTPAPAPPGPARDTMPEMARPAPAAPAAPPAALPAWGYPPHGPQAMTTTSPPPPPPPPAPPAATTPPATVKPNQVPIGDNAPKTPGTSGPGASTGTSNVPAPPPGAASANRPTAAPSTTGATTGARDVNKAFDPTTQQLDPRSGYTIDASGRVTPTAVATGAPTQLASGAGPGGRLPPQGGGEGSYTNGELTQVLGAATSAAPKNYDGSPPLPGQGAVTRPNFQAFTQQYNQGGRLSAGEAMLVGMMSNYRTLLSQGRAKEAAIMAWGLIQAANLEAASHGKVAVDAIRRGDYATARTQIAQGADYLPDSVRQSFSPDGRYMISTDIRTGQRLAVTPITGQHMLAMALGLSDGSMLWQALKEAASLLTPPDRNAEGRALKNQLLTRQIALADQRLARGNAPKGGGAGVSDAANAFNQFRASLPGAPPPPSVSNYFVQGGGDSGGGIENLDVQLEPD